MKIGGITLGPDSPLLTEGGARRKFERTEMDDQIALMELLVGPARKGKPRDGDGGMIPLHPELYLLTACNPNKGGRKPAAAGIAKAMGLMPSYPDLHLPVMRGPFLSLYLELKREGEKVGTTQRELHDLLRAQRNCVMSACGVEDGAAIVLGYLALPVNRPSVRPIGRFFGGVKIPDALEAWVESCYLTLDPRSAP